MKTSPLQKVIVLNIMFVLFCLSTAFTYVACLHFYYPNLMPFWYFLAGMFGIFLSIFPSMILAGMFGVITQFFYDWSEHRNNSND